MTDATYQEIGRSLSGRDHSTIINSINFINKALESNDREITDSIAIIKKKLSPQ